MAAGGMVASPAPTAAPPNQTNLEKIESFLNDSVYKEILENSLTYNTRLCIERRLRLPFIDTQTGVAQNHSSLFHHKRQRIPGLLPGQIYTYPRQRWRKKRRQYLVMNSRAFARAADSMMDGEIDMHNISQIENPALQDTDSKDSQLLLKDDVSKDWYYDDPDMLEMDTYDEPDPDSDLDYEETYSSKRTKRRKNAGRGRGATTDSPSTPGRKKGAGRGRKKAIHSFEPTPGDPDKPFACERTPGRRGRQPNNVPPPMHPQMMQPPLQSNSNPPTLPPNLPPTHPSPSIDDPPMPILLPEKIDPPPSTSMEIGKDKAAPSPYCDFCLGDSRENKKTGVMEELVSCADCGRSGKNGGKADEKGHKKGGRKKKV